MAPIGGFTTILMPLIATSSSRKETGFACAFASRIRGAAICGQPAGSSTGWSALRGGFVQMAVDARPPAPAPTADREFRRDGDEFLFTWPQYQLAIGVARLRETASGINAELTIESGILGPLHWGALNLTSTSQRETLVRKLEKRYGTPPQWEAIIERICRESAKAFRQGAPIVALRPVAPTATRELVEKLLPLGETTVLFGDGGSGKSYLGLAVALALATGTPLPAGLRPTQRTRTLLLDYETTEDEHQERLHDLIAGLGIDYTEGIFYRSMVRSVVDEAPLLRTEIARLDIGAVIVDSLAPATVSAEGIDSWHTTAIRTFNVLRSFGPATRLVIAHVSKAEADHRSGATRSFGSVFNRNLARSEWEVRPAEDDDPNALTIGLYHRKANRGRRHPPIGLRFEFQDGVIRLRSQDIADHPDLLARTSITYRIREKLLAGAKTSQEIATDVNADEATVARTLRRLKGQGKVVELDDHRDGNRKLWGLPAR